MSDGLRADPQEGTEQVARSAETAETRGWRATLDFCFVADSQDDAGLMLDTVSDWIERCGGFMQGGSTGAMADADVVPGSPLAMALAVERASDSSIVGAHPSPGAVLVGDRRGQAGSGGDRSAVTRSGGDS